MKRVKQDQTEEYYGIYAAWKRLIDAISGSSDKG